MPGGPEEFNRSLERAGRIADFLGAQTAYNSDAAAFLGQEIQLIAEQGGLGLEQARVGIEAR